MICDWCEKKIELINDQELKVLVQVGNEHFNPESLTIYICKQCTDIISVRDVMIRSSDKGSVLAVF